MRCLVVFALLLSLAAAAPKPQPQRVPPALLPLAKGKLTPSLRKMCTESTSNGEGGRFADCGPSSGRRLFQSSTPSTTSPLLWDNNNYALLSGPANTDTDLTYWLQATNFDDEIYGTTTGETMLQDDVPVGVSTCDGNQRAEWFKLNDLTFVMFAAQLPGFDGTCTNTMCKVKSIRVRIQSDDHGSGSDMTVTDGPTPSTGAGFRDGDGYYCEVVMRNDNTYYAASSGTTAMSNFGATMGQYKYGVPLDQSGTIPTAWPNPFNPASAGQLDPTLSTVFPNGATSTPLQYGANQMCGWDSGRTIRFPLQACKVLYRIHPTNWPLRISVTVQFDDSTNTDGVCAAYLATRTRKCNTDEGRYVSIGGSDAMGSPTPGVGNGNCTADPTDYSTNYMEFSPTDGHLMSYDGPNASPAGPFNSISKCNVAGDCTVCDSAPKQFDMAFKLRANAKCTGGTTCGCAFPCSNLNKVEQQCGGETASTAGGR